MKRGTDFGGIHSYLDLNLIQQKVEISPAEPKFNMVDIPGMDGSKDLTTQLTGRVHYKDRTITWTFALYPGENWDEKHRKVSGALNGRECKITLDSDPDYYYFGRLAVRSYRLDGMLRQIVVEAICRPYALKQEVTKLSVQLPKSTVVRVPVKNDRMPTVPTFVASLPTSIRLGDILINVPAGTSSNLWFEFQEGDNILEVATSAGDGSLVITYQEGSL